VRDWIHVSDHCSALDAVLQRGRDGEVYNIGGGCEMRNIDVAKLILRALGRSESLIQFVTDRPGHDRRYAIDSSRIERELGWQPQVTFEAGIRNTVEWYLQHQDWVNDVTTGSYRDWIETQYAKRGGGA